MNPKRMLATIAAIPFIVAIIVLSAPFVVAGAFLIWYDAGEESFREVGETREAVQLV
jgi:hypothetical protein